LSLLFAEQLSLSECFTNYRVVERVARKVNYSFLILRPIASMIVLSSTFSKTFEIEERREIGR